MANIVRYERRNYVTMATLRGEIYAIGGMNDHQQRVNTVEKYNPSDNQWTMVTPMIQVRSDAGAAVLNGEDFGNQG